MDEYEPSIKGFSNPDEESLVEEWKPEVIGETWAVAMF